MVLWRSAGPAAKDRRQEPSEYPRAPPANYHATGKPNQGRWSALVLPCTEVATFGADNAAHNQSLAPASAIEAASASPVLPLHVPLLPCTTATASVVMKGHAFVVCERRPPPSTDGGDGRHSCRCESRAGRCSQATPSSLRPVAVIAAATPRSLPRRSVCVRQPAHTHMLQLQV